MVTVSRRTPTTCGVAAVVSKGEGVELEGNGAAFSYSVRIRDAWTFVDWHFG